VSQFSLGGAQPRETSLAGRHIGAAATLDALRAAHAAHVATMEVTIAGRLR
jgi:hypothetical protein